MANVSRSSFCNAGKRECEKFNVTDAKENIKILVLHTGQVLQIRLLHGSILHLRPFTDCGSVMQNALMQKN